MLTDTAAVSVIVRFDKAGGTEAFESVGGGTASARTADVVHLAGTEDRRRFGFHLNLDLCEEIILGLLSFRPSCINKNSLNDCYFFPT